jgi:hypothetical protein
MAFILPSRKVTVSLLCPNNNHHTILLPMRLSPALPNDKGLFLQVAVYHKGLCHPRQPPYRGKPSPKQALGRILCCESQASRLPTNKRQLRISPPSFPHKTHTWTIHLTAFYAVGAKPSPILYLSHRLKPQRWKTPCPSLRLCLNGK